MTGDKMEDHDRSMFDRSMFIGEVVAGGSGRRPGSDDGPCLQCAWPCRHSLTDVYAVGGSKIRHGHDLTH